jgi:hypothetical protein
MKNVRYSIVVIALLAMTTHAAGQRPTATDKLQGASRDLNAPTELQAGMDDPTKKTVFVYYANETAPNAAEARNYETLIDWLGTSDNPKLQKIGQSIQGDLNKFSVIVDQELSTIKKRVAASKVGNGIPVVIFTNRLAREGWFQVAATGEASANDVPFTVPRLRGMVYSSNPLSHPVVFKMALAALSRHFDPETHQFILVTKSHGDGTHVLTPRVALDISSIGREPLLARLEKDVADMPDISRGGTLDMWKTGTLLDTWKGETVLDKEMGLGNEDLLVNDTQAKTDNQPADKELTGPPPKAGVTKASYVESILDISEATGMRFPLLFVEACRSQFDSDVLRRIGADGADIGLIYTSDLKGLQYTTLDYEKVFDRVDSGASLASAMHQELLAIYETQKAAREAGEKSSGTASPDEKSSSD